MDDLVGQILQRIESKDDEGRAKIKELAYSSTLGKVFVPNPGPQTEAYLSEADILLYGGEVGGGKSGLLFGLALNEYNRSLIVRKQFSDLEGVIDNMKAMLKTDEGFIGGQRPKYRKPDGGLISFEGMPQDGGVDTGKQGTAREFIGVDEGAQLSETQVRSLFGWIRRLGGEVENKAKCRMVIASNPPLDPIGDWLIDFFGPWLDSEHPFPAEEGELRYYIFSGDDKSLAVPESGYYTLDGQPYDGPEPDKHAIEAHSRTFIRSTVDDNPYLDSADYRRRINIMPEPYRTILRTGNFMLARQDQAFQVIPTAWVREAQARWTPEPYPGIPMCAIGVDVARGGADNTILAPRYDGWFAPLVVIPGVETPRGTDVAGHVIANRRDNAHVIIDMGGGYGGAPLEHLEQTIGEQYVHGHVPSSGTTERTMDGSLSFANKRSYDWWMLREALDPARPGGSFIALPPDPELVADLCAPTFSMSTGKIQVESKNDGVDSSGNLKPGLKKRLGRSPDRGDAVMMAWSEGNKALSGYITHGVPEHRIPNLRVIGGLTVNDKYSHRRRK